MMRMTPPRVLLAIGLVMLTGLAGIARTFAQAPATPQVKPAAATDQPIFRAGINTVRVDVIVTDKQGNPVTDLKLQDFEIQEDGKPQTADTFRLIKIDSETQLAYTQRGIRT